jgi:type II pantothenate kinase
MILGIDIGGTTTDIVCFNNRELSGFLTVTADDPVTSASGALGKFLKERGLSLKDIKSIAVTGVGASSIGNDLFGIPVVKVDEFNAIGLGGTYLSGLDLAIVVSMGTGTAIVKADGLEVTHLGGTGIGGGTLIGLSKFMLGITDFDTLIELAQGGNLKTVDLTVGDIAYEDFSNLPRDITASNFGKHSDKVIDADKALGIINLVCQAIGVMAVFASKNNQIDQVVLTGKMLRIPQARDIFKRLENLFKIQFIIPTNASFSTAVGAARYLIATHS